MGGVLDSVNQRTQLVGKNRLELLLFKISGVQGYGINVFKVREVLQCPPLNALPKSHSVIRGVTYIRGQAISVIDLNLAIGGKATQDIGEQFLIITEYNRSIQGFLVNSVDRIVNINWEEVQPPPMNGGHFNYLTAITQIDNKLVEILDVEKVLSDIFPNKSEVPVQEIPRFELGKNKNKKVLVADDSAVARKQIQRAISALGLQCEIAKDGKEALDLLTEAAKDGSIVDKYLLMISDVEMPVMDGYTLTSMVKSSSDLNQLKIILHTSLSGVFNQSMVEKVGADGFIAKFDPDELVNAVIEIINKLPN